MYLILFVKKREKKKEQHDEKYESFNQPNSSFRHEMLETDPKTESRRAILSGLTPYVQGLLLSRIPRSSFIFIPLNLDLVAVSIPPVSFSLSKANKHNWGKRRIARIRIEIPPISMGCTFSQVHGRSS